MIRLFVCLATLASLAACGSSAPRRPAPPSDPSLITVGSYESTQYLNRRYFDEATIYQRMRPTRTAMTGLHVHRYILSKHQPERRMIPLSDAYSLTGPKSLADFFVIDIVFDSDIAANGLPVYRAVVVPRGVTAADIGFPDLLTFRKGAFEFPLPLHNATTTEKGSLVSEWVACTSCADAVRAGLAQPLDFSDDGFKNAYDFMNSTLVTWTSSIERSRQQRDIAIFAKGLTLDDDGSFDGKYLVNADLDVLLEEANENTSLAVASEAHQSAREALDAYYDIRREPLKLRLNARVNEECELATFGYRTPASPRSIREDMRWIEKRFGEDVSCVQGVARNYDPAPYIDAYNAYVEQEAEAAERLSLRDKQRKRLPDPAKEVAVLNKRMQEHEEKARYEMSRGPGWIESLYASGTYKRPGSGVNYGAIVAGVMQDFANDMNRINQQNAEYARQLERMRVESQRSQSSGGYSNGSSMGSYEPVAATSSPSSTSSYSNASSTSGSAGGNKESNAADAERDAEREARNAELAAERAERDAERQRRDAERAAERARQAELKAALDAVQPRTGGLQGCVTVIDRIQRPGKSAHSSCPYSQPDRLSSEIIFRNSCGYPVNAYLRFGLDTGGEQTSGEYDIKPGRDRRTVDHCGMMSYEYWYEETTDSVNRRKDAVRQQFGDD